MFQIAAKIQQREVANTQLKLSYQHAMEEEQTEYVERLKSLQDQVQRMMIVYVSLLLVAYRTTVSFLCTGCDRTFVRSFVRSVVDSRFPNSLGMRGCRIDKQARLFVTGKFRTKLITAALLCPHSSAPSTVERGGRE